MAQFVAIKALINLKLKKTEENLANVKKKHDERFQFPKPASARFLSTPFSFSSSDLRSLFSQPNSQIRETLNLENINVRLEKLEIPDSLSTIFHDLPKPVQLFVASEILCIQQDYEEIIHYLDILANYKSSIFFGRALLVRGYANFKLLRLESTLEDLTVSYASYPTSEGRVMLEEILDRYE